MDVPNVIVGRSYRIQAAMAKLRMPTAKPGAMLAAARQLPGFVDHRLTMEEIAGDDPGFIEVDGKTMVRWCSPQGFFTVWFHEKGRSFNLDILDVLDGWQADDPRYELRFAEARELLRDLVRRTGFSLEPLATDDPGVAARLETLQKIYGVSTWLQGKDEEYLATVVLQNLGNDPFVRSSSRSA